MTTTAVLNGYSPVDYADFSGGLNLRDKADAVGDKEAIDLLNVAFGERGAIRQRDGYADLTPADLTNRVDSMSPFYTTPGLKQLVLGAGTRLDVVDQAGGPVASATGLAGGPYVFARFGTPTAEYLYAANGVDTLRRWDGSAWNAGATTATVNGVAGQAMPKAGAICVTAMHAGSASGTNASNRLVATAFGSQGGTFGGVAISPSLVIFSNPGAPETWELDGDTTTQRGRNYIYLTPGDGEQIVAAVTWRELVFIFKETKFFVIWGEQQVTTSQGTYTAFQVREVVNAVGLASKLAVTAGRDGVYFFNRRGVYVTHGDVPDLLSDVVSPMWLQDPDVYFRSSPINLAQLALVRAHWHMERLYLAVPTGGVTANDRVLVYDVPHKWWSLYDVPASALTSFRPDVLPQLCFGYSTGLKRVGRLVTGAQTDRGGTTIISRWRSGWGNYKLAQQLTLRETKAWGTGAAIVSFSTDFNRAFSTSADTIFGRPGNWPVNGAGTWDQWLAQYGNDWPGYGQVSDALIRRAVRGQVFSTQFANSPQSPTWSVHRVTRHLRETREPSIR